MTELQQNRYDRLLRRVGGLIGAKSMLNDALGELFPTLDVENVPGELLALQATTLGWGSTSLGAVAAVRNHHQLFNPLDSNVLIVATTVSLQTDAALGQSSEFRFSNFIGELTTLAGNERRRDTRAGALASIVAQLRTVQDAVNGGFDQRLQSLTIGSTTLTDANGLAVIFPGTGLTVTCQTTNLASTVSFMWRERVFERSELVD